MDPGSKRHRLATKPTFLPDQEILSGKEAQRISATMPPGKKLANAGRESTSNTPARAGEDRVEESDTATWFPSRKLYTPRTSVKRRSPDDEFGESGEENEGDTRPKTNFSSDDNMPFVRQSPNSAKRLKYLDDNSPFLGEQSTRFGPPPGVESVEDSSNGGRDSEDLEESSSSEDESDQKNLPESSQASPSRTKATKTTKKTHQKPTKCAEEWWERFHTTQTKILKSRSRRTFAKDGAEAKLESMKNHDPLAGNNSERDGEPTNYIDASNNSMWFKLLSGLDLPEECRRDSTSLEDASKGFGRDKIKIVIPEHDKSLHKTTWLLKGMKTSLWHHQLLGVHWMMGREFSIEGPKGGINADAMGLGKTIEMLAAIVANPRPKDAIKKKIGPTLIVSPACIVRMSCPWPDNKVLRGLRKLASSKGNQAPICATAVEDWIEKQREKQGGVLHNINWYRVVLDEAQNIKNEAVRTSHAANALLGKFRWAMSGTPMMNRREELYPYFRFVKDPAIPNLYMFTQEFCEEDNDECDKRMNETLGRIIVRRTMNDRVLGKEIVKLPPFTKKNNLICFNKATEILYQAVEERFRGLIVQGLEDEDPRKNMQYSIVAVLRLRQFIAHPLIIEPQMKIMFDIEELKDIQERMGGADVALHRRMDLWIRDLECGRENPKSFRFEDTDECGLCNEVEIEDAQQVRTCKNRHIFCRPCIDQYCAAQAATEQVDDGKMHCPALLCAGTFEFDRLKNVKSDPKERSSKQIMGRDENRYVPTLGTRSEWLEDVDAGKFTLPESTKLEAIRSMLLNWRAQEPSDKTIIFVQWKTMMLLIGMMLVEENFHFVYYTGDMCKKPRAQAMKTFTNMPEVTVMIMGLQVGSVGLNITCANRAIMVVDVRLALKQMRKNFLIAGTCKALGDHSQMSALGHVVEDEDGNPIDIIADYETLDGSEILDLLKKGDINIDIDGPGVFDDSETQRDANREDMGEPAVEDYANLEDSEEDALTRALKAQSMQATAEADDYYSEAYESSNV
ncbi:hypothetical protein EYC84_009951 [Monilinia fructicola]|uniref:Helicase ATP-binding domain-containing protein n=1 Tax=Monilinia fructicola TaxID=38448 RepID=A0A5M9JGA1_MONFR|nr:hypothetical protein EYC84_009951 [Monilinia fructicola]